MEVKSIWGSLALSVLSRVALLWYGEWQDKTMAVKFTDVDYYVVSDAARLLHQNMSPFHRPTYRYTPLLAWMLQPNVVLTQMFGKLLFVFFDVMTGYLIYSLLRSQGFNEKLSNVCACFWLLNPLAAAVSCRGSADSVMTFLVLLTLRLLQGRRYILAAISYALSVHFKIYSITYAMPIYFMLNEENLEKLGRKGHRLEQCIAYMWPTGRRLMFGAVVTVILLTMTGLCYHWYGWAFLENTYLYHIGRKDIRHNFSPYFYLIYLTAESPHSSILSLLVFIPQLILIVTFSITLYNDLPLCWFLITFVFVAYNKVCTSQYFLWYLCLLPLVLPNLRMSVKKGIAVITLWFIGQGLWLLPAYILEFEGFNTFTYVWSAGLVFFFINVYIVKVVLDNYIAKPHTKSQ
ncbi:GPI mannosyltransferase 1-like [Mizuhopecten yessoensis]|uniref:GPI alpha-1,4-mannosyltransferase I, catalytic subunit n=1 Tax=Mizuhopecten yessoensis TaxID=6573 RepID=A0A210PE79_MIZYE|nr:GPI mannosyltransferase 1-like [Mizuhopecten yessoensis]XP_021343820.1 GPI mannosyltransferase 1-like [Mizuhopecten yessoensis]OWF34777.1 GPI mannosyltransferase 1 [Mizuhopecten yessoensis]